MKTEFPYNKSYSPYLIHIGLWIFMILFVFDYHWFEVEWYTALLHSVIEILGYVFIFYFNLWLLKKYFETHSTICIICSLLIMFLYFVVIRFSGLEYLFYEASKMRNIFSIAMNAILFTGLSYLFFFTSRYVYSREENLQLETINKQLQIDSLKARINPHFIFNTLNNMNSLIVSKDDRLPAYLSKLSGLLRYSVDDGAQKVVSIQKEINYINDYLSLMRMQEPASENIDFYVEGEFENLYIIPFVTMTILENAVKHGDIMQNPEGYIHVNMIIEDQLIFEVSNSFSTADDGRVGSGLKNIKEQLTLMYGTDYSLSSRPTADKFTCTLVISTSKLTSR